MRAFAPDRYPMAGPGLLERRAGAARLPRGALSPTSALSLTAPAGPGLRRHARRRLPGARRASTRTAALGRRDPAVVSPGHRGALDVYVPLVDWGARFEAIRLPARLRVDLRTVDRRRSRRSRQGGSLDVQQVRSEARDAIAGYMKTLIACRARGARARPARRLRDPRRRGPRLRWTAALAVVTTVGDRRRARGAVPAARRDRPPAVLRARRGHPARAGGRRQRPALHPRARPGARRAARRPRAPGHRAGRTARRWPATRG